MQLVRKIKGIFDNIITGGLIERHRFSCRIDIINAPLITNNTVESFFHFFHKISDLFLLNNHFLEM